MAFVVKKRINLINGQLFIYLDTCPINWTIASDKNGHKQVP